VAHVDSSLVAARRGDRRTAVLILEFDGWSELEERHDHATLARLLRMAGARLRTTLRAEDFAARLEGPAFAVALAPGRRLDLTEALQIAGRLQRTLGEPVALGGADVPLSLSVGLALSEPLGQPTGEELLRAATLALLEARRSGPGAIRSYSEALRSRLDSRGHLAEEVALALSQGEVEAYFQPQISTRTGAITGFEALARWQHPTRGLLPPCEFLPAIEQAGLMTRLGERMLCAPCPPCATGSARGSTSLRGRQLFQRRALRSPPRGAHRLGARPLRPDRRPPRRRGARDGGCHAERGCGDPQPRGARAAGLLPRPRRLRTGQAPSAPSAASPSSASRSTAAS
jgi:diguanylate cyclase (GGDEF)-like protein